MEISFSFWIVQCTWLMATIHNSSPTKPSPRKWSRRRSLRPMHKYFSQIEMIPMWALADFSLFLLLQRSCSCSSSCFYFRFHFHFHFSFWIRNAGKNKVKPTFTRAHTHTQEWTERKSKYARKYVMPNGLRIVCAAHGFNYAKHWHITVQLQSQYNFILLDPFKVKQLAFCSRVWHLANPFSNVGTKSMRRMVFQHLCRSFNYCESQEVYATLCLNQSVDRTKWRPAYTLTLSHCAWIGFFLMLCRMAAIWLIMLQSNGNNLHTI